MKIPPDFFEYLRQRVTASDVVSSKVSLTKKGAEYLGLCPFHSEKTPSFTVNNHKRFYHCFGCGSHGDIMGFISHTEGVSYNDAAIKIANQFGIEIPKLTKKEAEHYEEIDKLQDILELAADFYKRKFNKECSAYLSNRSISLSSIQNFDLGYAPKGQDLQKFLESKNIPLILMQKAGLVSKGEDGYKSEIFRNRLMFPIRNIYNKVIAFGGRAFGDAKPKYINSPETILFNKSETLYGEDKATSSAYKKNRMILVEGYLDVISMHQAGFSETVAALGTAVTEKHIAKIWKICDEVILLLDGDEAGVRAATKASKILLPILKNDKKASFIILPENNDPDDYLRTSGARALTSLIDSRNPLSEFLWKSELNAKQVTKAEDFADLEFRLMSHVKNLQDNLIAKNYQNFFKDQLWNLRISKKNTKKYTKSQIPLSASIVIKYDYTELEHLEYSMISLIFKFPDLLSSQDVMEEFEYLNIETKNLDCIRKLILENLAILQSEEDIAVLLTKIKDLMENSGFSEIYSLLSDQNSVFLNLSMSDLPTSNLWKLFLKKHHVVLLKQEYSTILTQTDTESFERAMEYRKHIIQLEQEIINFVDI